MEIRILTFLIFACVTIVINVALVFVAYKIFSGLTTKVESTLSEFEKSSETRQWLESLQTASEHAVSVTQATKERMAEIEPMIARAQQNYARTLEQADSRLQEVAEKINKSADQMREAVAGPASSVLAFAAGVTKAVETIKGGE